MGCLLYWYDQSPFSQEYSLPCHSTSTTVLATTTLPNSQFPNTTTTRVIYPINFLLIALTSFKITEDIDYNFVLKNLALEFVPQAHDSKIKVSQYIYHNLIP